MKEITLDTVVKKSEDVFAGSIDNEMVAMSIESGKYYHMNETGSRILALLDKPHSMREVCEEMERSYRIEDSVCREDVLEYLQDMLKYSLISAE